MPEIGERREADQRLRQLERKQPAADREADREHQRQRDEKNQPLQRRPSQRWPAPGIAHDARHSSTSELDDPVCSAAVAGTTD